MRPRLGPVDVVVAGEVCVAEEIYLRVVGLLEERCCSGEVDGEADAGVEDVEGGCYGAAYAVTDDGVGRGVERGGEFKGWEMAG